MLEWTFCLVNIDEHTAVVVAEVDSNGWEGYLMRDALPKPEAEAFLKQLKRELG